MKIKKLLFAALMMVAAVSYGQNTPNVITTAVPFVSINPDSRGGSMGDCGVATTPDVYSMHYNPAKYVFMEEKLAVGLGYSPWLRNLVPDMNLAYLAASYKINDRSAVAMSLRYFSAGQVDFRDQNNNELGVYNPNEWALDATYSRMLGDYLSGAVAGRFIYSNLIQNAADYSRPGISVAADIGLYYKRPVSLKTVDADVMWGVSITNIGSKVNYNTSSVRRDFIPTTLRVGAGMNFEIDEYNTLGFTFDLTKLLVPTPPIKYPGTDSILYGMDNDVAVVTGMIHSFYDAPGYSYNEAYEGESAPYKPIGKFIEELYEINVGLGIEYWYNNIFSVRAGFFNEPDLKGGRRYVTVGAALKYSVFGLDVSYLIPVGHKYVGSNPLENTLRFNLTYMMGKKKS
jgi:hypothetical protein